MCNACGFYCCALDTFDRCGCENCPCPECWPPGCAVCGDFVYDDSDVCDSCAEFEREAGDAG